MSKPKYDREYLGKTITAENYREILKSGGRDTINFHTRHLKAYLKGKDTFKHGYRYDKDGKVTGPATFKVQQKLTLIPTEDQDDVTQLAE